MARLALRYPGYGWERNAGYATRDHVAGLRELGVTRVHRRTYQRIRAILEGDQLAFDLDSDAGADAEAAAEAFGVTTIAVEVEAGARDALLTAALPAASV